MEDTLKALEESVKIGRRKDAKTATTTLLENKVPPGDILAALIRGMDDVGKRFRANEIYVPEVLISARAMNTAMILLEPEMVKAGMKPDYKVVIGTVEGDLHDIGKNLVAMMLKGANFEIIDLGTNVTPAQYVAAAKEHNADVVALSALLTTTMPSIKSTVDEFKSQGLDSVKIMIGGAPITQEYADEIGAHGYASDAASAVDIARELVSA